ncbi:MAG: hypothetical protein BRC57_14665 [Cyanobacteria bacterium QS_8_48_54]|nr:MAG: hypothetical protein BRC57_14665 [Cyanobacteria bacterium QS_8_48_54]
MSSQIERFNNTLQIERFNNTLRQRCCRLVRKGLSFSKNCFNHEGAILYLSTIIIGVTIE